MHPYVKKLQSKPENVKKSILVLSLTVSMSLVLLIWFYNLGDRFSKQEVVEKSRDDVKPFSLLSNTISNTFKNMSASVGNISKVKDKLTETSKQTKINN